MGRTTFRRRARLPLTSILAAAVLCLVPSTMFAASWGSTQCGPNWQVSICITDNSDMTVFYSGFTSAMISSSDATLANITNLTDVYAHRTTTSSGADAWAYYSTVADTGYKAWEWCPSGSSRTGTDPNVVCKPQAAQYNSYYATWYSQAFNRSFITCHEYGHFLGLHHNYDYPYSCMNTNAYSASFNAGDISLVNQHY